MNANVEAKVGHVKKQAAGGPAHGQLVNMRVGGRRRLTVFAAETKMPPHSALLGPHTEDGSWVLMLFLPQLEARTTTNVLRCVVAELQLRAALGESIPERAPLARAA